MNIGTRILAAIALIAALCCALASNGRAQEGVVSDLNVSSPGHNVHIFPTVNRVATLGNLGMAGTPLSYHGGPVMTKANTYAIFWIPTKLQNGAATSLPTHYQNVQTALLSQYPGHGIDNNNTQYYMTSRVGFFWFTSYIQNAGGFVASYVDTTPYPASGCTDSYTPGNCLTDAQLQTEIQNVITLKGWPTGINNMFLLYTSSGEGSCTDSTSASCAYKAPLPWNAYCAYHSYFFMGSNPVIYGNEPYGDPNVCQVAGTPSPNSDAAADAAATVTSHELTEAITDPELNAWYDGSGAEIGDKCAWNYGTNTYDSAKANQSWFVSFSNLIFGGGPIGYYELQQEYDNHAGGCVQLGP
jgi:hypothetical protein